VFPPRALAALADEREPRAQYWRDTIDSQEPGRHVLVVDGHDGVVGFATAGPVRGDDQEAARTGELYAIYVHPKAWGRGVGQALMADVLERLRAEGFDDAILWVLEDNPRTRRFYELGGWRLDSGPQEDIFLDTSVRVVRYRVPLVALG